MRRPKSTSSANATSKRLKVNNKAEVERKKSTAQPPPVPFDSGDDNARPMSYEEKEQLALDIHFVPGDQLINVVNIIRNGEMSVSYLNPDVVEVDFETLKPSMLRALKSFVSLYPRKKPLGEHVEKPRNEMNKAEQQGAGWFNRSPIFKFQ